MTASIELIQDDQENLGGAAETAGAGDAATSRAPLKIIVLSHSVGCGGAERAALNLCAYWSGRGAEVTLYTGYDLTLPLYNYYPIPAGVARRTLDFNYEITGGFRKIVEEIGRFRRLLRAIDSTGADIVVGSTTAMASRVGLARLVLRRKFLAVGWEHTHFGVASRTRRFVRRLLYRYLDRLVLLTERDEIRYAGLTKQLVIENAPGVDGAVDERVRTGSRTVMAVGRIAREKGYDSLVEVARAVHRHQPDIRFMVYGEGEEREAIEKIIAEAGLDHVIELCGRRDDIAGAYRHAEVFVLTSRFEGFPLAMLEAMSFGLPVVSFDCPTGPREILGTGATSGLVAAGDVNAAAEKILAVFSDDGLYQQMSQDSINRSRRFRMPVIGERWDRFLNIQWGESGRQAGAVERDRR